MMPFSLKASYRQQNRYVNGKVQWVVSKWCHLGIYNPVYNPVPVILPEAIVCGLTYDKVIWNCSIFSIISELSLCCQMQY